MIQELTEAMTTLDRRVHARINGMVQRERDSRVNPQRTRDGRPVCFNCGTTGHVQSACPQRRLHEQRPVPRNVLSPSPNMERDRYQPGLLPRRQAFGPPGNQGRIAVMTENWYHQDNYMAPMENYHEWDTEMDDEYDGEWDYYYDYKSDDKCPQANEGFSQNPRATSNYGSCLAIRTNPPGSVAQRKEPYVNAFADCAENKPKHKVRDVHHHARKQREKRQERAKLPGPITETKNEKITVSATKPKEDQKQKVKRQERTSRQEQ